MSFVGYLSSPTLTVQPQWHDTGRQKLLLKFLYFDEYASQIMYCCILYSNRLLCTCNWFWCCCPQLSGIQYDNISTLVSFIKFLKMLVKTFFCTAHPLLSVGKCLKAGKPTTIQITLLQQTSKASFHVPDAELSIHTLSLAPSVYGVVVVLLSPILSSSLCTTVMSQLILTPWSMESLWRCIKFIRPIARKVFYPWFYAKAPRHFYHF